jgi:hypothetical protein
MAATFSPNKNLIEPASGSFVNAWASPVNSDWAAIDTCFGGHTNIDVTGVTAGTYALTIAQYQPPLIHWTGPLSGNLTYVLPSGVGGFWCLFNNTTGSFTLSFGSSGGQSFAITQGLGLLAFCDGAGFIFDSQQPTTAQANAEAFATAADAVVLSTAEAFASNAANTAQSNAQTFARNANNINTGTVGAAFLPLAGNLGGITIQADPGGTPSGSPGDIFYYY